MAPLSNRVLTAGVNSTALWTDGVAAGVGRSGTAREGTAGRLGPPADGLGRALGEGLGVGGGEDAAVTTTEPSAPATTEG